MDNQEGNSGGVRWFPGGRVVRIWRFHCCGPGSIPDWETEIPQAVLGGTNNNNNNNNNKNTP